MYVKVVSTPPSTDFKLGAKNGMQHLGVKAILTGKYSYLA